MNTLKKSAETVQAALDAAGIECQVREFPASTRTAADAAAAIGCTVAEIAKSIIFGLPQSERGVLVIASGVNRIDEQRVSEHLGEPVGKATPELVRQLTGFAIGGVPPVGHTTALPILIDRDLLALTTIWAAAGTPNAVFELTPGQLVALTGGDVIDVAAPD